LKNARLEQEKKILHDIEKEILLVIDEGIVTQHETMLRNAVAEYIEDFPGTHVACIF